MADRDETAAQAFYAGARRGKAGAQAEGEESPSPREQEARGFYGGATKPSNPVSKVKSGPNTTGKLPSLERVEPTT